MKGMFAIASLAGLLLVAVATSGSGSLRAVASQGCTNHSLRGAYGYQGTGTIYQAGQEVGDFAAAGRVVFDGNGNLQGKQEGTNLGSPSGPQIFSGTYTVDSDCTGDATVVFVGMPQGTPASTYHFAIVEGGEQIDAAQTSEGGVLGFSLQKQSEGGDN